MNTASHLLPVSSKYSFSIHIFCKININWSVGQGLNNLQKCILCNLLNFKSLQLLFLNLEIDRCFHFLKSKCFSSLAHLSLNKMCTKGGATRTGGKSVNMVISSMSQKPTAKDLKVFFHK